MRQPKQRHKPKHKSTSFSVLHTKKIMKGIVISMLVVLAMAHLMVQQGEAVDCRQVYSSLAPCIDYLTKGGIPTTACCLGVKNIQASAKSTADKQATCECCKEAANRFPVREDEASTLPGKCGIPTNIPISKNINCQSIN